MPAVSNPSRRLRRLLALACAGAASAALGAAAAVAPVHAATAVSSTAEPDGGVRVSVAPVGTTTVAAGSPITVEVEVVNDGDTVIDAGTVSFAIAADGIDDAGKLAQWTGSAGRPPGATQVAERAATALPIGSTTSFLFTIPADATDRDDPVIGLSATIDVPGGSSASASTAVANTLVTSGEGIGLALAYPLTVPADTAGLIGADDLEAWTAPLGLLTRQLEAVTGHPVAVGIDPRIPASIRALGASAPESAVDWLAALERMPNDVFPLAYADADLAVQSQAGLEAPLEPLGFSDTLDPADFPAAPGPEADAGGSGGSDDEPGEPTGDQAPSASPAPGGVPTDDALLDWDYTRTDIAWPADDSVASGDLDRFAAGGLTTAILAPGNVEAAGGSIAAAATIEGRGAVVAHAGLQADLRRAASASTETAWRGAVADAVAGLALAPDAASIALGTFARSAGSSADRVGDTLDALATSAWSRPATLAEAIGAPRARGRSCPSPRTTSGVRTSSGCSQRRRRSTSSPTCSRIRRC
ncbi:hypothetical protein GCM10025870_18600 [Agromyces marinus]|uniref:DUF11 domain-containing protein n=1 Tax=Agromyces marinus TaxID=1389020 RepID=A0ABN6YBP1_9MICO|nr:DUF6049 family protein [Agromyces marinus]BDZ54787.1 hypothetical protein GCM10025870_18600 [Agromyces marinus]